MQDEFDAGLTSTYRLQLHKGFDFKAAADRASYLRALGVSHVYVSPIMRAKPGSMHGYDVVDFNEINPELGGEPGFRAFAAELRAQGLGLIVDIVPNHMAIGGDDNPYWLDLLREGHDSAYADFFDVDFDAAGLDGKILAPFLGDSYQEVLAKGELQLKPFHDGFAVSYHEHVFPLREADADTVRAAQSSPEQLHALLERQAYRLASWRAANDRINYRRFFEITSLIGVRIERQQAFDLVHRAPLALYAEGLIDGVRVDHVDGLSDPAAYCRRLRAALEARRDLRPQGRRQTAYVIVEKILADDEATPRWAIQGTTGYDFMNEVSALQHDPRGAQPLSRFWADLSGRSPSFDAEETLARDELLNRNFNGQLQALTRAMHREALAVSGDRDLTHGAMRRAIVAVLRHLRVYRSYAISGAENPGAGADLTEAFAAARADPTRDDQALDLLQALINARSDGSDLREAVRRFHQLSAPVAAKAVEDTAFYRYGPLLSRNDVGFGPARFAMANAEFHRHMAARARDWPHAMVATATHDHKRGEDVRARLAVLSEMPERWIARCREWSALNAPLRQSGYDAADEYMLFQTVVGAWPPALRADDSEGLAAFAERLAQWQTKALREAKLRSSWLTPDADYERCAQDYVRAALNPGPSARFLRSVAAFVADIESAGFANGLTQIALRCLLPGVPDLYQGCELWDFSLVDPDNRRPVDFELRANLLRDPLALKSNLLRQLLALRRQAPDLFAFGDYTPVETDAPEHAFAFTRRHDDKAMLAVVCLRTAAPLYGASRLTPARAFWGEAAVRFDAAGFTPLRGGGASLRLADLFEQEPVAVWVKA